MFESPYNGAVYVTVIVEDVIEDVEIDWGALGGPLAKNELKFTYELFPSIL